MPAQPPTRPARPQRRTPRTPQTKQKPASASPSIKVCSDYDQDASPEQQTYENVFATHAGAAGAWFRTAPAERSPCGARPAPRLFFRGSCEDARQLLVAIAV